MPLVIHGYGAGTASASATSQIPAATGASDAAARSASSCALMSGNASLRQQEQLSYQRRIPSSMGEPRVAAFFDVDHTLLDVNSGMHWARHQRRAGLISTMDFLRAALWMVRYRLTTFDQESL